jgi:hypothetical protein
MKRALSVLLFAGLVFSAARCNPFAPDQSVELGVSQIDVPSSVTAGTSFNVVLTVQLGGCLSFDRIDVVRSDNAANLTAWGKDASKGRTDIMCPQNIVYEPHTYEVKPPFSGPFIVQVNRGRLSPLTATVQVQ